MKFDHLKMKLNRFFWFFSFVTVSLQMSIAVFDCSIEQRIRGISRHLLPMFRFLHRMKLICYVNAQWWWRSFRWRSKRSLNVDPLHLSIGSVALPQEKLWKHLIDGKRSSFFLHQREKERHCCWCSMNVVTRAVCLSSKPVQVRWMNNREDRWMHWRTIIGLSDWKRKEKKRTGKERRKTRVTDNY